MEKRESNCRGGYDVKTHMVYTLCNNMVYTFAVYCEREN